MVVAVRPWQKVVWASSELAGGRPGGRLVAASRPRQDQVGGGGARVVRFGIIGYEGKAKVDEW